MWHLDDVKEFYRHLDDVKEFSTGVSTELTNDTTEQVMSISEAELIG